MPYSYRWLVPRISLKEKKNCLLLLDSNRCENPGPASDKQTGNSSAVKVMGSKVKERRSRPLKVSSIRDLLLRTGVRGNPVSSPLSHSLGQAEPSTTSLQTVRVFTCPFHVALRGDTTLGTFAPTTSPEDGDNEPWLFCQIWSPEGDTER